MRLSSVLTGSENIFEESRSWPPKDAHLLTPNTRVASHEKGDFADVVKVLGLAMGDDLSVLFLIT